MITRRTLLKLVGLLPLVGPAVAKALAHAPPAVPRVCGTYLPATFPKWSKAVDGLENAGEWAIEIERARLPSGFAFPREGQVWEAIRDCEIQFWPRVWKQPMKLENVEIKAGEKVQVVHIDGLKPVFVSFVALRGSVPVPANQSFKVDGLSECALQLKTARTVGDLVQNECHQVFFMEAFRLVTGHGVTLKRLLCAKAPRTSLPIRAS